MIFALGKVYRIRFEMRDIVLRVPMVCNIILRYSTKT